jgi:hypothetical protein
VAERCILPRESSPSPRGTIGGGKRSGARDRGAGSGREVSQASRREKRTSASNPGSSIKLGHQSRPGPTLRMTTLRDRHD